MGQISIQPSSSSGGSLGVRTEMMNDEPFCKVARSKQRSAMRYRFGICLCFFVVGLLFLPPIACTQDNASENPGVNSGDYNVQQALETGYRANWINGNQDTYDTFINLGSGVRLLDYTFDMRSLDHKGLMFDNLSLSAFGLGGDPNDVVRLRIGKNKWYDFQGLFRRDKNFWDYNLFANPLNPTNSNPAVAITSSPNAMDTVRHMQDYNLTLLPQSRLRFRLGYSRNVNQGPVLASTDSGVAPQLTENVRTTVNAFRVGIDFRVLPKTSLSYDQFLEHDREDDITTDQNRTFQLANGAPVDLGIVWSTVGAEVLPCATPFSNPTTTPPTVTPSCNGILSYSRVGRPRNSMPTERFRFQSSYFQNLEMEGSVGYSSSDNSVPDFNETTNGWVSRSATRVSTTGGPAVAKRVSVNADWSGVYAVTDKFRIQDSFRYENWRIPGLWATADSNIFGAAGTNQVGLALPLSLFSQVSPSAAKTFGALCPAAPYAQAGCPLHTSSSGADVTNELSYQFLGQNLKSNTLELQYDFTKRFSGHIGYLYTSRTIAQSSATFDTGETYFPGGGGTAANHYLAARGDCAVVGSAPPAGCTLNPDGSITEGSPTNLVPEAGNDTSRLVTNIDENALLLGFTARPVDALRIDGDSQIGRNSNAYTRTSPTELEIYKVHAKYQPRPWVNIDGAIDIEENANTLYQVNGKEHGRTYSFTTMLLPNSKVTLEIGYNYNDIYSQAEVCFAYSTVPATPSPFGACPIAGSPVPLAALSTYSSNQHFAYANVIWKPAKRVSTSLGYAGTFVDGNTLFLNPLQPAGTLAFNYQKPFAMVQFDLHKGLSYKMSWNYYGYDAKGPLNIVGLQPIPSADFNGSTATFAFRYMF
jgi:hypothetical protein